MPSGYRQPTACFILVVAIVLIAGPGWAWLYDGGQVQRAGIVVKESASPVWVAAPFTVNSRACATQFGAAIGKVYGSSGMGYNVYLTRTPNDAPSSAIASWFISPKSVIMQYYYAQPPSPLYLEPNTPYFLVFAPNSNNFSGAISWSQQGYYGLGTVDYGKTWYKLALPLCVRVDGYYVPEPASVAILVAGLIVLGIKPARKLRFVSRPGEDREL